jgi:hypothetical protein
MKPTPTPLMTTQPATESTSDLQEQIHRRAYELYEQRGRNDGHELDVATSRVGGDSIEGRKQSPHRDWHFVAASRPVRLPQRVLIFALAGQPAQLGLL